MDEIAPYRVGKLPKILSKSVRTFPVKGRQKSRDFEHKGESCLLPLVTLTEYERADGHLMQHLWYREMNSKSLKNTTLIPLPIRFLNILT